MSSCIIGPTWDLSASTEGGLGHCFLRRVGEVGGKGLVVVVVAAVGIEAALHSSIAVSSDSLTESIAVPMSSEWRNNLRPWNKTITLTIT